MSQDINVLALVKGAERYVFLRFASNPDLSFTWYDAAVLSQKIRQESQKTSPIGRRFSLPLPTDKEDLL